MHIIHIHYVCVYKLYLHAGKPVFQDGTKWKKLIKRFRNKRIKRNAQIYLHLNIYTVHIEIFHFYRWKESIDRLYRIGIYWEKFAIPGAPIYYFDKSCFLDLSTQCVGSHETVKKLYLTYAKFILV